MILAWCNAQSKRSIKPFVGRRPSAGRQSRRVGADRRSRRRRGETMKTRVKWVEGASFVGESGSGHAVVIDGAPEYGGRNLGPRPMEMVLTGTAACTAFDVVLILRRARQP